jgi:hypothetical protein
MSIQTAPQTVNEATAPIAPRDVHITAVPARNGDGEPWLDAEILRTSQEWLAADEAPDPIEDSCPEPDATLTNGVKVTRAGAEKKTIVLPLTMAQILASMRQLTGDWPRRVGNCLFVHDKHGIAWLDTPSALIGYLHTRVGKVVWHGGPSFVKQGEMFAECERTSTEYVNVESLPHEPMLTDHYYACEEIPPGNGCHLRWLVDRFRPETPIDRDLIQAAIMTPLWGGPPGCRPAFVVTSDDGRGSGKTTVAEVVGELFEGVLQFSANEEIGKIKTRLLTPDALTRRVALLDNVKSHRFSWADLEAMITASTVNGHRMYAGDATRPNTLTWFITLNGAALSTDMAQRSVIIKVLRPERSATWKETTQAYVREHRRDILADIIGILRSPPETLAQFSRWASWERDILSRLPEPAEAQRVILERQNVVDVDAEEATVIEDYFADQLRRLEYDTNTERIFVPSQVAARWYGWSTNQPNVSTIVASRSLSQMATEGRLHFLTIPGRSWGRGYLWTGQDWTGTHTETDLQERIRDRKT